MSEHDTNPGRGRAATRPFWADRGWWRRAGSASVAVWGSTGVAFLATVVAARALGPSDYGAVVLALATATLIATFLDLTLEEGLVHHGFRALAEGDTAGLRALLKVALTMDVVIGAAVSALILGLAEPIADLVSAGRLDPSLIRLAALQTLAMTVDGTTAAVLFLAERPEIRAWATAGMNLVRLGAVLVAVSVGGAEAVVAAYAISTAAGATAQGVLAWRLGWRSWRTSEQRRGFGDSARKLVHFGIHSSITTALNSAGNALIPIVLGRLAGPSAVGLFRVASLPQYAADLATAPLRLLVFPEQAKLAAGGRVDDLRRMVKGWMAIASALGLVGAVAGWFLLPWLLPALYGEDFQGAVGTARIFLIPAFMSLMMAWTKTFAAAIGRPQIRTLVSVGPLVIAVPITALLSEQGSDAAAIGMAATAVTTSIAYLVITFHYLRKGELVPAGAGRAAPPPYGDADLVGR